MPPVTLPWMQSSWNNQIGGWLDPRAGLGVVEKITVFCLQGRKLISPDGNKNETKLRYRYSL